MGNILDSWSRFWKGDSEQQGTPSSHGFFKYILILGTVGLLLMLFARQGPEPSDADSPVTTAPAVVTAAETSLRSETDTLEKQLANLLRNIDGVGNVDVMITLEAGVEKMLATETTREYRVTEEADTSGGQRVISEERSSIKPIIVRDEQRRTEQPYVIKEMRPIIQSVLVVADGAHDPAIKLEIHRAVRTVLNVADYRVYVAARRQ